MVTRGMVLIAAAVLLSIVSTKGQRSPHAELFATSDRCMACHNGLRTPSGEDVSIGASWRASMMANSSRDPYFQAGVRREVLDHPAAGQDIQDGCATCHMPMSRTEARLNGSHGRVFDHLPVTRERDRIDRLAHDGVACSMCHQITDQDLGTPASFTGGYVVAAPDKNRRPAPAQGRPVFGPFKIEPGMTTIMRSATGFQPTEALHFRQSEMCGTCHTLITKAFGPQGEVIGELPEQTPFHEWKHSAFNTEQRSCQSCHMPVVQEDTPIASVLGVPRKGLARHTFVGGNAFMQRMLNRYRSDLGVLATAADLETSLKVTVDNLQRSTAELSFDRVEQTGGRLVASIRVRNLTGHKLPTGYPSRRAWLHLTVRDRNGRVVFESGAVEPTGAINGNDNDRDAMAVERHYTEIHSPNEVQIYESVMGDSAGRPTTGLLTGTEYLKDNRLVPRGFEKSSADRWVAVVGGAARDNDFNDGDDRLRYVIDVNPVDGPFQIDAELRFQVIGFRWADNLRSYKAEETNRFVGYYDSMASSSSELLASARHVVN
jgi:hypothetical protein